MGVFTVIIASGQTCERIWIRKWFDDGNDTCPKTGLKLAHLSLIPNASMKDLISKWCTEYEITVEDPSMQSDVLHLLETSSISIASFGSYINDLCFPVDISNMCSQEEARACIAQTSGCISYVAILLENGSHEDQEHALDILLSCSQHVEYCHLVKDESDIFPALAYVRGRQVHWNCYGSLDAATTMMNDKNAINQATSYPKMLTTLGKTSLTRHFLE